MTSEWTWHLLWVTVIPSSLSPFLLSPSSLPSSLQPPIITSFPPLNPVATVTLCLLTHNYACGFKTLQKFAITAFTADVVKEIDRLVQLIESLIFSFLRLQLLVPDELMSAICGLPECCLLVYQREIELCTSHHRRKIKIIKEKEVTLNKLELSPDRGQ